MVCLGSLPELRKQGKNHRSRAGDIRKQALPHLENCVVGQDCSLVPSISQDRQEPPELPYGLLEVSGREAKAVVLELC